MRILRHRLVSFGVLLALGLGSAAFAAHLYLDADGHPESCALCAAAHHGAAVVPQISPVESAMASSRLALATMAVDRTVEPPVPSSPRAPPAS
jgi:hypothetical protein